jgi:phosphoglycolate phosphatase-like HAD superfamily hydrolase
VPLLALFDVDGTLFLTPDELSGKAMVSSLEGVYGVDLPDNPVERVDHRAQTAKRITREILRAAGLDDEAIDERLDSWCSRFSEDYLGLLAEADTSDWEVRPGAEQALAGLERAGVRLALLTGNPEPIARGRMERLGLARFFKPGEGAFGCDAEERVDLIMLARVRAGGWPVQETVAIGDTPRDVASAHEAGIRSIVIRSPRASAEQVDEADAVLNDMDALARTLLDWS